MFSVFIDIEKLYHSLDPTALGIIHITAAGLGPIFITALLL